MMMWLLFGLTDGDQVDPEGGDDGFLVNYQNNRRRRWRSARFHYRRGPN